MKTFVPLCLLFSFASGSTSPPTSPPSSPGPASGSVSSAGCGSGPGSVCCRTKTVGAVTYGLLGEGATPSDCPSPCIYTSDLPGDNTQYCFAPGNLPSVCTGGSSGEDTNGRLLDLEERTVALLYTVGALNSSIETLTETIIATNPILIKGEKLHALNITELFLEWKILAALPSALSSPEQDMLLDAITADMETEHLVKEVFLATRHRTKFIRSTLESEKVGHNFRTARTMQRTVRNVSGELAFSMQSSLSVMEFALEEQCVRLNGGDCDPAQCLPEGDRYRSITGCCNNVAEERWGSTSQPFMRFLPMDYQDGMSIPRGGLRESSLPSARKVSAAVHTSKEKQNSNLSPSVMLMQFGQILDHDLTLTPEQDAECCDEEVVEFQNLLDDELKQCFNINVTGDIFYAEKGLEGCLPFTRSEAICTGNSTVQYREQFNAVTAFIDASNVYGSDPDIARGLRADSWRSGQPTHGEMRVHDTGPAIPSRIQCGFASVSPANSPEDLVAGDERAIEQPGLASLHSLFVNEHNRIVRDLKNHEMIKSAFKTSGTDEEQMEADEFLYQETRRLVGAQMQNIVYDEFLPLVLGSEVIEQFGLSLEETSSYNGAVNPTIRNSFATVAFRFGHSLIPSIFEHPQPSAVHSVHDRWAVDDNFFEFEEFVLGSDNSGKGWMETITGSLEQASPALDTAINPLVTNFLFCGDQCQLPGGFGQDLGARNIQRGRDHGIPPYSDFRQLCGLPALTTWASRPVEIGLDDWERLRSVYTSVQDIDFFPGGLAEAAQDPTGLLGPTFSCILARQFQALKDGDRYFFTHPSEGSQGERGLRSTSRQTVRARTLGDVVCDNTAAVGTRQNVMTTLGDSLPCSGRTGLDIDGIVADILTTRAVHL